MAQRRASTILDLPHPLGPTTAVTPGVISITVFWAKDLKPIISRRFKRIGSSIWGIFWQFSPAKSSRNISQLGGASQAKITIYGGTPENLPQDIVRSKLPV